MHSRSHCRQSHLSCCRHSHRSWCRSHRSCCRRSHLICCRRSHRSCCRQCCCCRQSSRRWRHGNGQSWHGCFTSDHRVFSRRNGSKLPTPGNCKRGVLFLHRFHPLITFPLVLVELSFPRWAQAHGGCQTLKFMVIKGFTINGRIIRWQALLVRLSRCLRNIAIATRMLIRHRRSFGSPIVTSRRDLLIFRLALSILRHRIKVSRNGIWQRWFGHGVRHILQGNVENQASNFNLFISRNTGW